MSTIQKHNQYQNKLDSFWHRVFDVVQQSNEDIVTSPQTLPVTWFSGICVAQEPKGHYMYSIPFVAPQGLVHSACPPFLCLQCLSTAMAQDLLHPTAFTYLEWQLGLATRGPLLSVEPNYGVCCHQTCMRQTKYPILFMTMAQTHLLSYKS